MGREYLPKFALNLWLNVGRKYTIHGSYGKGQQKRCNEGNDDFIVWDVYTYTLDLHIGLVILKIYKHDTTSRVLLKTYI